MCKLSAVVISVLICAGASNASEHHYETHDIEYFLDGINRDPLDGMNASISFERKTLRIASTLYHLSECLGSTAKVCFISDALTFSSEPTNGAASWTVDGLEFKAVGLCMSNLCKKMKMVLNVIHSSRHGNDIEFYYNDTCGLVGWSTTYPKENGYVETFMQLLPADAKGK